MSNEHPSDKLGTAEDALAWMNRTRADGDILYRGQSQVWPTVKPSITRVCEDLQRRMWTVTRWFCATGAAHITGYRIEEMHDRLSVLQHYIGRSPVIDLSGTPEVALYFALKHSANTPGSTPCVVYSIDRRKSDAVFTDHDFLVLPLNEGGAKHRWLRQDGYSVASPHAWWDRDAVQAFDMLKLHGVSCFKFRRQDNDERLVAHLGDLESIDDDPLALAVRGSAQDIAKSLGLWTPCMKKVFDDTATIDPDTLLRSRIAKVLDRAKALGASELQAILFELDASFQRNVWDTSFEAELGAAERQLIDKETPS